MRRSICYCEPTVAYAGEVNNWRFIYTSASPLPKGSRVRFDLQSKGRDLDWEVPSTDLKKNTNVIFLELENGKVLQAKTVNTPDSYVPLYEFVIPSEVPAGSTLTVVVGSTKNDQASARKFGTKAQNTSQRRRSFLLYIDPVGKGNFGEPEVFSLDVRGNQLKTIRVLAPSFVARNKRFDVVVRFEDEFGNLTSYASEDTLIELSHEHLRENLNWKLFIPETGFINLPNLYFNEPGDYTIQLKNTRTKEVFRSSPIKCFSDNNKHLYWGLLHGESERVDSTENIESCLRHFRDDKAMNFYASSPFESQEETSNDIWKLICQNVTEFDEADRFTAFIGFQWAGESPEEGVRHIIYAKENKLLPRKKDQKYNTLKKLYKTYHPKEIISIPTLTEGKGFEYNFDDFDPEFERVVEIYNAWGSSENTKKEGNTRPITCVGKKGIQETADGSIIKALLKNKRFGFVAGGLDDRGIYSDFFEGDQVQYTPGLTAIMATEHSRAALFEAIYNRNCYATTGERMVVGLYLAGFPMGSETNTAVKHGLNVNRHISGYAAGTTKLHRVELIRNGKVLKSYEPTSYSFEFTYDDMDPLKSVVIDAKDKKPPFVFYYLRIIQEDGHMAWSSPIWVDYIPGSATGKGIVKAKATAKPVSKKPVLTLDDEDDEEEDEDFEDYDDEE